MSGDQFPTDQAAIKDAMECLRAKFGKDIKLKTAANGSYDVTPVQNWPAAGSYLVVDLRDNQVTQFLVFEKGNGFSWKQ
jgi:hypothetical protein